MKSMNKQAEELRQKKTSELTELIGRERGVVRDFRFSTAGSATRDVRAVRTAKKNIARALTELRGRELNSASEEQG